MSNVDEYITYIFTWRTSRDERVCPICHPLDGQVIFFDLFAPVLVSDTHGAVWDLNADHSLAHGVRRYRCRCSLDVDVEVDWDKIVEFNELKTNLELMGINIEWSKERFKLSSSITEARSQMINFLEPVKAAKVEVADLNNLWRQYLSLAHDIGLPREIMQVATRLQQIHLTGQSAIRTLRLLKLALLEAGPVGWALFIGSAAITGFMLADQMQVRRPRY